MPDILENILQLRGIPKESPTVMQDGSKSVAFMEKRIIYSITEDKTLLVFHAQADLTQKPNYRTVNTLNNNTLEGKYTIADQKVYNYDLSLPKANITDLEAFAAYAFKQAQDGYTILNTTSDDKRRKLVAEKKAEMKAAQSK